MSKIYFTLTGTNHYFGKEFLKKGTKIRLEKEPDNEYDKEAIKVTYERSGKDWICSKQFLYSTWRFHECRKNL